VVHLSRAILVSSPMSNMPVGLLSSLRWPMVVSPRASCYSFIMP